MSEEKIAIPKKTQHHFPTTKIKRIIQENQQIGKLSNLVPPLVERSLEMFLEELLKESEGVAAANGPCKMTPSVLKKALLGMEKYEFMRDTVDDVDDVIMARTNSKTKTEKPAIKRAKSGQEKEEGGRGRKKNKPVEDGAEEEAEQSNS